MQARRRTSSRSRNTHRWVGVVGGIYFLAMAVSGVLLNHPGLISGLDLPRSWMPGEYTYRNWNRNSLRGAVQGPARERYLYGEAGVWRRDPGSPEPVADADGFEPTVYYRDTRALLLVHGPAPYLLAGTRGGLLARPLSGGPWGPVTLGGSGSRESVVDLTLAGNRLLALTRDRLYAASPSWPPRFADATPGRAPEPQRGIPLFRLIFHLHSGETWGLPGRLAVDAVGVVSAFFSLTGAWFWWRKRRRALARGLGGRVARRGLTWHLRWGLWATPLVLLVAITGLLQRPPLLIAVAFAEYPQDLHPGPVDPNPWHDVLRKMVYDPSHSDLLLATADGFYAGPADGSRAFEPVSGGPPVSVMGATVLERARDGLLRVGSMSGLFVWDPASGLVEDAFTGAPPGRGARGPVGEFQVVGWMREPGGRVLVADYDRGLLDTEGRARSVPMPAEMRNGGRISLWHALLELHNGRVFGFLLGWWSWVVVPVGGLALTVVVLTGATGRWRALRRRRAVAGGCRPG